MGTGNIRVGAVIVFIASLLALTPGGMRATAWQVVAIAQQTGVDSSAIVHHINMGGSNAWLLETPTRADILLDDGDSLEQYGVDAYVLHTPGHTPGSSSLIVNGSLAFVGDLLASSGKVHAQHSFAGDWQEVARSLTRLRAVAPEVIYPGRGSEPITTEQLQGVSANFVD